MNPIDLLPVVLIFGVMYFLLVRPQIREKQEHDKLVASLAKDDQVVTGSGLHGTVVSVSDDTVVLEVAEKTRIVVDKTSITRRRAEPKPA